MGTRRRLTKEDIEAAAPGWLWDQDAPGLGVRVTASGVRAYVYRYGSGRRGAVRRLTLGQHGEITLAQARILAKRLAGAVAEGRDPVAEARSARGIPTLAEFAVAYRARAEKRASSQAKDAQLLRLHLLPALGSRPLDQIQRQDVARVHHAMGATPTAANRALALLSHVYACAWRWGVLPVERNPTRGVERYRERPRERYLSADELQALGRSLAVEAAQGNPWGAGALAVLVMTGARASEVLGLRRDDLAGGLARLRERKAGPLALVVPAAAVALLERLPRARGCSYYFPGRPEGRARDGQGRAVGPLSLWALERIWRRVRDRAGLVDVRIHDLRHTFASVLAGRGESLPVIGGLLGHSQPGTTARYAHLAPGPLREAAEGAADAISEALKG